jgi:L-aspartate oxidase
MTHHVGIFKTKEGLIKGNLEMFEIYKKVQKIYNQHKLTNGLCELRNMVSIAHLIIQQAQSITTNKGVFYNHDYA